MGEIRIGISGWTSPPWRGRFYPKGWPQHRELEYAARQVGSIRSTAHSIRFSVLRVTAPGKSDAGRLRFLD